MSPALKGLVKRGFAAFGLQVARVPPRQGVEAEADVPVTVGKFEILMPGDSAIRTLFSLNPHYLSELGRLVTAALEKYPDLRLIDVGANCGDTVAIVKSAADIPIECIEGDERCFDLLQRNIRQFGGVSAHKLFLGEESTAITATVEKEGWNTTIIPSANRADATMTIQLTCLDDFLKDRQGVHCYRILKIDTEGFDCRIIRGGLQYIEAVKPIVMFEYNRENLRRIGEDGLDTLYSLQDLGYNVALFYDGQARLLLSTTLGNTDLIGDLHEYANGTDGAIHYYDLCLFHETEDDIALAFQQTERVHRAR